MMKQLTAPRLLLLSLALSACWGSSAVVAETPPPVPEEQELQRYSDLAPEEPYWSLRLAIVKIANGDPLGAELALLTALERSPGYAPALSLLSKLYFDLGRHEEAIEKLEAARTQIESFPDGIPEEFLAGLALHYDALDDLDTSEALMAEIPHSGDAQIPSPRVYLALRGESPETATDLAAAALKRDDKSAVNHNNYGITRLRAGDPEGARAAFVNAIDLDPNLPGPYYNLAILEKYYLLDDATAAEWFRLYEKRAQDDPDGLTDVFRESDPQAMRENGDE